VRDRGAILRNGKAHKTNVPRFHRPIAAPAGRRASIAP
jgi:hypothetical protein